MVEYSWNERNKKGKKLLVIHSTSKAYSFNGFQELLLSGHEQVQYVKFAQSSYHIPTNH